MIEILCILAIVAALTITAMQGYKYAVWKHRFNETVYIYNMIKQNIEIAKQNPGMVDKYTQLFLDNCQIDEDGAADCEPMYIDMRDLISDVSFGDNYRAVLAPAEVAIYAYIDSDGSPSLAAAFSDTRTCTAFWKMERDVRKLSLPTDGQIEKICYFKEEEE